MIIEVDQMIRHIEDFVVRSTDKAIVVGGIVGTEIERFALEGITAVHDFNKVLVVQCCQDYIGMMKEPMPNVKFIGDILSPVLMDDPMKPINPFKPRFENPIPRFGYELNKSILANYNATVVLNAHLMDTLLANALMNACNGPIIFVVDPIEEPYWASRGFGINEIPVIADTLLKVSPVVAMARHLVGFDTRAINTRAKGTVNEIKKMNKRSIGKIDDKQYVSNDYELVREINQRQIDTPLRKNQKLLVTSDIDVMVDESNQRSSLMFGSMLVVHSTTTRPLMRMRLYNSKIIYATNVIYDANYNALIGHKSDVRVRPANIISHHNMNQHRFNHMVFVVSPDIPLTVNTRYSMLKNSNSLTIVNSFK